MFSEQLFQKNFSCLLQSNERLNDIDISLEKAKDKRDICDSVSEAQSWQASNQKGIFLTNFNRRGPDPENDCQQIQKEVDRISSISLPNRLSLYSDYHQDHHLFKSLLKFRELTKGIGVDPDVDVITTSSSINHLVALGTGSGVALMQMIEAFNPTHLTIIVSEWEDYISSFWYIDWIQLHEQFAAINGKLYIARVKNEDELLAEVIHSSILLLDGTYCYKAPGLSNQLDEYSKILWSIRPDSIFTYLGYTVDEYNMVLNTVETLKGRIKAKP